MTKKNQKNDALDTLSGMRESDLVSLSKSLLDQMILASDIKNMDELSPQKLQEARLVLGYLNATHGLMRTKMSLFKMVGIESKIKAVEAKFNAMKDAE